MSIKTFDYLKSLPEIEHKILDAISRVLHSNQLILGPETDLFEQKFAQYVGAKHCIGVTSGTTALHLSLLALGIGAGDEVITVSNTCTPTIAAIRLCGANPVFIDVSDDDFMMDITQLKMNINERTRCILPVHLWGSCVNMSAILETAKAHNLAVIEDCAQACGTIYRNQHVGTYGDTGCFSFYPTKNLGAYGDAGAIVTNDDQLASRLRMMRTYGYDTSAVSQIEGMNARISEIQSAILHIKLQVFDQWLERRLGIAKIYNQGISNHLISTPQLPQNCVPSYHQYVIRCKHRDELMDWLRSNNIAFGIHYPVPVHLMPAYSSLVSKQLKLPITEQSCNEILSLPIHEALTSEEAQSVVGILNQFNI